MGLLRYKDRIATNDRPHERKTPLPFLGAAPRVAPRVSGGALFLAAAVAAASVGITVLVPVLVDRTTFLLPLLAIVASSWMLGWRPGAAAAAASLILIAPAMMRMNGGTGLTPDDAFRLAAFACVAAVMVMLARARERAEGQLRISEALASVVVDNGPVLIAGADARGNTAVFNRACEQLTGFSRAEVLGRPFVETFVPESWQSAVVARFRDEPIEALATPHQNPWVTRADGERLIEWRCFRVLGADGEPLTIGIGQDVTERSEAERHAGEALAREQTAREALASGNREKERFIVTLAHELRTPLNAAMGWFHIMRTGEPAEAAAKAPETIERNLRVMQALIEDIVDFNRAEFGKLTLNIRAVSPAVMVQEVATSARGIADARKVGLRCEVGDDVPEIEADPKRLRQIISNVLHNAVKFTPAGGSVTVSAAGTADDWCHITVADTGSGIAPEHLNRIFDPLWQPDTAERGDGLGLGLALVKRLIEAHKGQVSVASVPGRGTTVTLMLPVAQSGSGTVAV